MWGVAAAVVAAVAVCVAVVVAGVAVEAEEWLCCEPLRLLRAF